MQCVVARWWLVNGAGSDLEAIITLQIASIESISGPLLRNSLENWKASGDSSQHKKLLFFWTKNLELSLEMLSQGPVSYLDNLIFLWLALLLYIWRVTFNITEASWCTSIYCSRMKSSSSCLFRTPRASFVHTGLGKIHYRQGSVCITYRVNTKRSHQHCSVALFN